jgi:hypothetical protein
LQANLITQSACPAIKERTERGKAEKRKGDERIEEKKTEVVKELFIYLLIYLFFLSSLYVH